MDKGVIEGIVAGSSRGGTSLPVITPSAADLGTSSNSPTISFPSIPRREIPPIQNVGSPRSLRRMSPGTRASSRPTRRGLSTG